MRITPEQVFTHAVQDNLISREQLQRLFITVKQVLNAAHRVQLLCPFEKSEPEGFLKEDMSQILACMVVAGYVCGECSETGFQSSANSHYPCKVFKHRCKVEDEKVVNKCSPIILVVKALLGTF